jgi:SSS family solute:Na+ symporter
MQGIMIVIGICIILYTVLGGMEAVIWTEVVQGVIKTLGAILILYLIVKEIPGGFSGIISIGKEHNKFSLGTLSPNFTESSFWVILFYGFFMNLNNFGMDQNYVQRYHTAVDQKQAVKSVWLCVMLYVPASLLFFLIGTSLFAYYQVHPEWIASVKQQVAIENLGSQAGAAAIDHAVSVMQPSEYGDKVMPHFMVTKLPTGIVGLIISAILSAAMSTISSGMNASATVFTVDIYQRYFDKKLLDSRKLYILRVATVLFGLAGLGAGIAMIGVKSLLDTWWEISGIFAGGMLGLFLLGIISRRTKSPEAFTATLIGIFVILWMTFSKFVPDRYAFLRNPLDKNMVIVIGTLTIFLAGMLLTYAKRSPEPVEQN